MEITLLVVVVASQVVVVVLLAKLHRRYAEKTKALETLARLLESMDHDQPTWHRVLETYLHERTHDLLEIMGAIVLGLREIKTILQDEDRKGC